MIRRAAPLTLALALALAGCTAGASSKAAGRLRVVAGFYPLAYLAERIGGAAVAVTDLTPSGGEPHDLELRASQVADVARADLALYLRGFQPSVDRAVRPATALDLATAAPLEQGDPHVWLDPVRMIAMADAVAVRLVKLTPVHEKEIKARRDALLADLSALDRAFRDHLGSCTRHDLVTSHAAFGYLARRYGLHQVGIAGLTPDAEPTARRLAEVARFVTEKKVTTIFFETLVSPKLAQTIAHEAKVRTAVLDPIEGLEAGSREDYLTLMRANLAALVTALGCR